MKVARNLVWPVYGVSVFQFRVWLFIPASGNLAERDMGAPWNGRKLAAWGSAFRFVSCSLEGKTCYNSWGGLLPVKVCHDQIMVDLPLQFGIVLDLRISFPSLCNLPLPCFIKKG